MYSVHSSVFGKCGYTMRPVPISEDDTALFNANFTPRVAVTYQNHVKEIRRMVKQQGVGFWIRFVTSFRSHNERHRLMDGIVFSRAEAVFIDMLHLLTCGDNLNELTRLMSSLRAMQAAITANDYQVLMDPVLRVLMTCYDKPLDGLRLYFRFAAGLVVMFRRWRQVAWRSKKENDVLRPWEPPLHWQEMTPRDYSEWTFEGHLLGMYGPDVPRLLGLPPGLLCWLPDELRNGHVIYPPIAIEEVPLLQDITGRGRNRKKCRRRKNRQFDDSFSAYDTYSTNAAPSSGDSGVCLIEQSHDAVAVDAMGSQKDVSDINKDDSAVTLEKDPSSTVMVGFNLVEGSTTINEKSSADMIESQRDRVDFEAATCVDKSRTPSQTDGILQEGSPVSEENVKLVCAISKNESKEVVGYMRTEDYVKDSDDYVEENFSVPYVSDYELCGIPDSISGDWKKCSRCTEDLFPRTHCYCSRVCPFLDWKFRPRNEHSLLSRLHEAGAGDSIAQNMQYYVWSDDCPADEERPDYLYVLECRSPGLVQSGQYVHPGGIPMLEQNYGSTYDQCLHIYRRDGPPRIMMNAGNFRPNCCMEELNHLGRPSPWVESPGNFIHPSAIGYIDTPTMDYMGPTSEMRRRGQQNRRFRQRRGRQAPYLATIEECFDSTNITEMQTFTDTSSVAHNDTLVLSSNKKHWNHKQRPEATESLKDETMVDDEKKSNISPTNETFSVTSADNIVTEENKPVSVDTPATSAASATSTSSATSNTIVSSPTSAAGSCIKDYALAVCGLLGRSGKGSEVKKNTENTEENVNVESVNSKASPLDIRNSRKYKGKVGKTAEDEGHGKTVKAASFKDIMRSTDKIKKFGGRTDCSVTDLGKSKVTKSRMTSKCVLSIDVAKDDKSAANNETSNNLSSHVGKDLTSHINVSKHSIPNNDEKVLEKRRKWKSVWTRRRENETRHPEEKAISESDGTKEREVNNRYNPETREGVPENVPDILKQVENSELKSFWKENYEAPKPQRKSRPRRDSKWRSNNQENSIGSDFIQNSNRVDVTPIAKLDIVPAVEPNDKESLLQEMKTLPPPVHPTATESCISEIGWYEETLAEDKDREKLGQLCRTDTGEQNICSQKKNKSRKWKRKQKNNKKAKEERNFTELINKEKTNDELSVKDYNRKENEAKSLYYNLQKKSKVDENNDQILHNMDHIMKSTTQKDNVSVNAYIVSEMKKQQTNKGIIEEHRIISKPLNELQKNMSQNTVEFSKQTVDYCKTILDEVLKHLPENTENSQVNRQISGNISESLKEEKTQKKPDSNSQNKHCCKTVLEDSVHDISENQSDSLLATSEDQFNGVTTSADKTAGKENIRAEPVKDSTCESFGYKNKEYKTVIANKRKQACVIRTLNYVTGLKINFPFLSKRDLLRFCFTNGEAQRCFEGLFEKASKCGILPLTFPRNISLGVPQPPPYRRKKILLLRHCDNCNILEKTLGEYGECAQCKTVSIHPPRVYCNKMCQRIDWKHRHRAEHTRHSSEQNHREN